MFTITACREITIVMYVLYKNCIFLFSFLTDQFDLRPMIQAGIAGFKCFLIHSGVDEFPHVTEEDLHEAMKQLQGTNSVLLVNI